MIKWFYLILGGMAGTVARYVLSGLVYEWWNGAGLIFLMAHSPSIW